MSSTVRRVALAHVAQDQKPGTSGLRKKVKVFEAAGYLEQFVEALFVAIGADALRGAELVVGGDGRFYNNVALQTIVRMCAAHGVARVVTGQHGVLSTPAVSALVRARGSLGAIVLTASHNPGGPEHDFGIKYNVRNGGPAPEAVTDAIYRASCALTEYSIVEHTPDVDLSVCGVTHVGTGAAAAAAGAAAGASGASMAVEVVDSVDNYLLTMRSVFDMAALRAFVHRSDVRVYIDCLNGVTGPYARRIFVDELGLPASCVVHATPLPDFGGLHPDPNLTHCHELVEKVNELGCTLGAAFDGDGDRNMIVAANTFLTPSDSVAMIAANHQHIKYFAAGLKGVARSMPTSAALDVVAAQMGLRCFEVPTGWKFFGNLMDAGMLSLCGEESFGTGSDHVREKDGVWAALAWLSILAGHNKDSAAPLVTLGDIMRAHWSKFGRHYYCRYDYEEVDAGAAARMMAHLRASVGSAAGTAIGGGFTVQTADDFKYTDPIDGSVSAAQGIRYLMTDGSRFVVRLSGTGSSGATIRLYLEKYEPATGVVDADAQVRLRPLIDAALGVMRLGEFVGRENPDVIT